MCHRFDFRNRLLLDKNTISLSDLLATKLQVVQMTEREYKDIIALIHDHQVGDSDAPETINGRYIGQLCAENWGIYKTFTNGISNIMLALSQYQMDTQYQEVVRDRLQELLKIIENTPKTMAWKIRYVLAKRCGGMSYPKKTRRSWMCMSSDTPETRLHVEAVFPVDPLLNSLIYTQLVFLRPRKQSNGESSCFRKRSNWLGEERLLP